MKIKLNKKGWEVRLLSEDEMIEHFKKTSRDEENMGFLFGCCDKINQQILICKSLHVEARISTLKHELTHAWLWSYGRCDDEFSEEDLCDVVSAINDDITALTNKLEKFIKEGV